MTSAAAGLYVPADAAAHRTAVDHTAAERETADFGRAAMLVWRPLLEAETSR